MNHISQLCEGLNGDELRVIESITERLVVGKKEYGGLDINRDPRNWSSEAHEEFLDASVYLAIKTLR